MKTWGHQYTENDDYYTYMGGFVNSIMEQFEEKLQAVVSLPNNEKANVIRFTIIVTHNMLKSIEHVVLTEEQKGKILLAVRWCIGLTAEPDPTIKNQEGLINFVNQDMHDMVNWVNTLNR